MFCKICRIFQVNEHYVMKVVGTPCDTSCHYSLLFLVLSGVGGLYVPTRLLKYTCTCMFQLDDLSSSGLSLFVEITKITMPILFEEEQLI